MSLYESFLSRLSARIGTSNSVEMNMKSEDILAGLTQDFNDFNRNVELLNSRSFISIPTTPDSVCSNKSIKKN
ncbi:hypothetical protein BLA29_014749 [Euroglyphus maynei]|uniref:Uncharacterized protein n=1 Tax=Euroglyphus maynei TaxID=6958 RepID=A0A1Y3BH29_EURMA|nr:hypothetical protein BLA29_014749 [Euroglyphus maynei]